MTPDDYCATQIGGAGSYLYYGLLFLPRDQRRAANAIHAFAREIADIAEECRDPGVARVKLDWWREEIERAGADAARHPVTQSLTAAMRLGAFECGCLLSLLDATAATLAPVRHETFTALWAHCRDIGAPPQLLAATVFGISDPETRRHAETLGTALHLVDVLAGVGRDVRHDRLFLPREDLQRFDVVDTDVCACRHTSAFARLMEFETERARRQLDEAVANLPDTDRRHQLPGLILAASARALLDEIRRDGYRVLERRLALTPVRKLWIAWSTRAHEFQRTRRAA